MRLSANHFVGRSGSAWADDSSHMIVAPHELSKTQRREGQFLRFWLKVFQAPCAFSEIHRSHSSPIASVVMMKTSDRRCEQT
jgi:hypothetical protein